MHRLPWLICALLALSACCQRPCHQRGWIGGTTTPVVRCGTGSTRPLAADARGVTGMPADVAASRALLLTRVPPGSPLARAGLHEGDLLLALDGAPLGDPIAFREGIEARQPGACVQLEVWRAGRRFGIPVVVGRETFRRIAVVGAYVPVPAGLALDLWPFDDGVDVLGLVVARRRAERQDLETPERRMRRAAAPDRAGPPVRQETLDVRVFPLAVGTGVEVLDQEAVPPSDGSG